MKKWILQIALACISITMVNNVLANKIAYPDVDVYKTTQISAQEINKKYFNQFQEIANIMLSTESLTSKTNLQKTESLLRETTDGIKKMGNFALVKVAPIMYPGVNHIYISIDIVDLKDKKRLSYFNPKPTKSITDPDGLIAMWQTYQKIGMDILFKGKTAPGFKTCPAFDCIFGFDDPRLKKFQPIFDKKVPENKLQLIQILRQDENPKKRAAAAFLLAHITNGKELIEILTPSIQDPDGEVRNNVMRVLGIIAIKSKNLEFPIKQIVSALDYPLVQDRNKALFVLAFIANQPRYSEYILQHASSELIDNLKMSQPDVHSLAYQILVIMSGKKFSERDYQAWTSWINNHKT